MKNLFVYGVPGVGKTHWTRNHTKENDIQLIELDSVRYKAQADYTLDENPFAYLGTTDAYKALGIRNTKNITQGLREVRKTLQPYIIEEILKQKTSYLAESAFIDPLQVNNYGEPILIIKKYRRFHRRQFFQNREKSKYMRRNFRTARILQKYLIKEASEQDIQIINI